VTERDHRALRLREKLVLSCLGTVAPGKAADDPASLFEKPVRMLSKERFLGIRNGKAVATKDQLTPEPDA
jgi:hypothetical protein